MASIEYPTRAAARHDVARAGANVELIDGRLYLKRLVAPMDSPEATMAWVEGDVLMRGALNHLAFGTDPMIDVADWCDVGVATLRDYHDYPDADMLGHYVAD